MVCEVAALHRAVARRPNSLGRVLDNPAVADGALERPPRGVEDLLHLRGRHLSLGFTHPRLYLAGPDFSETSAAHRGTT